MNAPLYEQVARAIAERIKRGIYRVGDRLPSIRALCREQLVAINTVKEAYYRLEARGIVDSRPRSGYFVRPRPRSVLKPRTHTEAFDARTATTSELWHQVHRDARRYAAAGCLVSPSEVLITSGCTASGDGNLHHLTGRNHHHG